MRLTVAAIEPERAVGRRCEAASSEKGRDGAAGGDFCPRSGSRAEGPEVVDRACAARLERSSRARCMSLRNRPNLFACAGEAQYTNTVETSVPSITPAPIHQGNPPLLLFCIGRRTNTAIDEHTQNVCTYRLSIDRQRPRASRRASRRSPRHCERKGWSLWQRPPSTIRQPGGRPRGR